MGGARSRGRDDCCFAPTEQQYGERTPDHIGETAGDSISR